MRLGLISAAVVSLSAVNGAVYGATLVNFIPDPESPSIPEFVFNNSGVLGTSQFSTGPGAISNGDGTLPVGLQLAPGLEVNTSLTVPTAGFHGGLVNFDGSTNFRDVSLTFTGLNDAGTVTSVLGFLIQPLTTGTFTLTSTVDAGAGGGVVVLLTGTIGAGTVIFGGSGSSAGTVTLSANNVDYTGGLIHTALLLAGGNPNDGNLAFSMSDITPTLSIGANNVMSSFTGNGVGTFDVVAIPEPASLGLLGLGMLALGRRRRG